MKCRYVIQLNHLVRGVCVCGSDNPMNPDASLNIAYTTYVPIELDPTS